MNNNLEKIKNELDQHGYGTIDYPDQLRNSVLELVDSFKELCAQNLGHKVGMNYQNSMGYENRNRNVTPDIVDHKESFYIKSTYEFPENHTPSDTDKNFVTSCKKLLIEIIPLIKESTEIFSQISETGLLEFFDYSALTLRAIHYYPDINEEIAHHHVDRGGQTYHLYESTDGLESYWNNKWNTVHFNEGQTIYFPCIQAQYATKSKLKGLCHRVVSTEHSKVHGRYSLVLFVDYNKLDRKYSMTKTGPIEKAFLPGQNYTLTFNQLQDYFEEKLLN
jgi:isopenicillin N synthase-like dioxygenase